MDSISFVLKAVWYYCVLLNSLGVQPQRGGLCCLIQYPNIYPFFIGTLRLAVCKE